MRIDAHHHFWRPARGDYGWLEQAPSTIVRDFLPGDLAPLLAARGIDRTILVQAAPSEAETHFLLDLAAETPFVAGVVGWVDFEAPDAALRVRAAAARPGLVGLRPMVQDLADDAWLARSELDPVFEALVETGLRFDALVRPRQLPALLKRIARNPQLKVVIDHGAKPEIASGPFAAFEAWGRAMRGLAETGAYCKLSGLVTEASEDWRVDDLRPYADLLIKAFGPGRLMWGSDWPVLNLNGDYLAWSDAADRLMEGLSADDRGRVRGGAAAEFYGVRA
ncbi:MAG: amidohydrolase family protein [Phenylobacterium sp.]|nr:amidohydrolase family protein [Phenylobacterium sp.]